VAAREVNPPAATVACLATGLRATLHPVLVAAMATAGLAS
jgi:hypothetical protein